MVVRLRFFMLVIILLGITSMLSFIWPIMLWALVAIIPFLLVGLYDALQSKLNILRNYPVWGHFRYLLLSIRPHIQQYFIQSDQNGRPFNKEMRDLVYSRAQGTEDNVPFGTQLDVNTPGHTWINHSLTPVKPCLVGTRVKVGGPQCTQPYSASRFNISAMSFGALSAEAIRALNRGAKLAECAHDTGEGGLSRHHLSEGGDIIWEIGSGYFGCRTPDGHFNPEMFAEKAQHPNVKMVELKLSQGAKPGHGAILPGEKVSAEIAEARNVPIGQDCLSPALHSTFSTPLEMMRFISTMRDLSGGKPAGFKLCIGIRSEFMAICKAMLETGIYPDFITIDGAEGGTGAAPVEFSDYVGTPIDEALIFVHNCLVGTNLREHIRLIASGKIISGFDILTKIALGADMCNSARGMMFALGCVQSRRCHTNTCPTGVATQDPGRRYALDVDTKSQYVANYHAHTVQSFLHVLGAAGLQRPEELHPSHIHRRINERHVLTYAEIYHYMAPNQLLDGTAPKEYLRDWELANANTFNVSFGETHRAKSQDAA